MTPQQPDNRQYDCFLHNPKKLIFFSKNLKSLIYISPLKKNLKT